MTRNPERKLNVVPGKRSSTSSYILAGYLLTDPSTSFKVKIHANWPKFLWKMAVLVAQHSFNVTGGENGFESYSQHES